MKILNAPCSFSYTVKNSRFLAEIFPCQNQSEARNLLKEQKQKYPDSTHVVHAFVTGFSKEINGMSDDGEPSGTAGRPVLDVLKGLDATNIFLTVTRWFGGTLLGTGGLVKAYSDGAKQVIKSAVEQNLFEEYIQKSDFSFSCDYSMYKTIKHAMKEFQIWDLQETFLSD
ncbi:MAG: YigZ family protein, partial [Spirochaetia bacterium]|nr:YigZ family protein [Spirochaetia bacterium]